MDNGEVLEIHPSKAVKTKEEVPCQGIMVDGLGVGDVGNIVLRDRKLLSEGGLIIVAVGIDRSTGEVVSGPDIISRGFVYVREAEDLIEQMRRIAFDRLQICRVEGIRDWNAMKNWVRDDLRDYIYQTTKRSPVILPIFMEV